MTTRGATLSCVATVWMMSACGEGALLEDGGLHVDAGFDAKVSDFGGSASGTLKIDVDIDMLVDAELSESCLRVYVADLADEPVSDAQVLMGGSDAPAVATLIDPGYYEVIQPNLSESYSLSVQRGADFLVDVTFIAPPSRTVTLDGTPTVSMSLPITWTSLNPTLPAIDISVGSGTAITYYGNDLTDDGFELLPATAFPTAGDYGITVGWQRQLVLNSPDSRIRANFNVVAFRGLVE
jgi:hypothetical protein